MKLGILQCDDVSPELQGQFGHYPEMFTKSLGAVEPSLLFEVFPVYQGVFPESPETCDAWLITGSKSGVYDKKSWISPLEDFVRQLYQKNIKTLGICFGHQLIAQALGGEVRKSKKGWGLGLTRQTIVQTRSWMTEQPGTLDLLVLHQDQVITVPGEGEVLFNSDFCPNFGIQYGECFLSVQGHPEFSREYLTALINLRKGTIIPEKTVDAALASLSANNHSHLMNQWLVTFLNS